jgi:hypothetical protein
MIKIILTFLLTIIELILYYKFNKFASYPARALLYAYLANWYYQERKHSGILNMSDKLFIGACFVLIISPLPAYINDSIIGKILEFALLMFSQQLIIGILLFRSYFSSLLLYLLNNGFRLSCLDFTSCR